jgi:alpha/beta superfamily hydrolase
LNAQTLKFSVPGPAGRIEAVVDEPALESGQSVQGSVVISHPHPLFGGTMDNKVVQTLARAFVLTGWRAVRFNFRGVGASEGVYDEGRGELADLLAVVGKLVPEGSLSLAGFSFGAFVTTHAVQALYPQRALDSLVLVGTAATRFNVSPVPETLHQRSLVVHGEQDDTVPLSDVMTWARPQSLPVTVVPGVSHFFHGQLPLLRGLVVRHIHSCQSLT